MIEKLIAYQSRDVVKYTGVNERELRHWCDKKVIIPRVADVVGVPGHRREFSFKDLVEIAILKALTFGGMSLYRARHILLHYRWHGSDLPNITYIVIEDGNILYTENLRFIGSDREMNITTLIAIRNIKNQLKESVKQGLKHYDK